MYLARKGEGFPADFLRTRIRSRRTTLVRDWQGLLRERSPLGNLAIQRYGAARTPAEVRQAAREEIQWVYRLMEQNLRGVFRSYFLLYEIRTAVLYLRFLSGKEKERGERVLSESLLPKSALEALKKAGDVTSAVLETGRTFAPVSNPSALLLSFERSGLRGFEEELITAFLEQTVQEGLHPILKGFFVRLIDSRNIMGLYKSIRFNAGEPPRFVRGGSVKERTHAEVFGKRDPAGPGNLVRRLTGKSLHAVDTPSISNVLSQGLSGFIRKSGRDPLGIGIILGYLWQCSVEAGNLSILFHGADMDRDTVSAELVK